MAVYINEPREPDVSLADMQNATGGAVRWDLERLTTEISLKIVSDLGQTRSYKVLSQLITKDKADLFFEKLVRSRVYPVLRSAYVPEKNIELQSPLISRNKLGVVWRGHDGLGDILRAYWPFPDVPLILGNSTSFRRLAKAIARKQLNRLKQMRRFLHRLFNSESKVEQLLDIGPTIAVHYIEGVDLSRRSELFWYPTSGIDPQRILIFFDSVPSSNPGNRISESILKKIEESGMRWVATQENVVERKGVSVWGPTAIKNSLVSNYKSFKAPINYKEKFVKGSSLHLLATIDIWRSFYTDFNCKMHIGMEAGLEENVAQNIALDLVEGVRVGWKRSESLMVGGNELGHHPYHVGFTWNSRGVEDFVRNRNRNNTIVVSGYPYDVSVKYSDNPKESRSHLNDLGAKFTVALFDNAFYSVGIFSRKMMADFYSVFLRWVLDDEQVGILVKTKRPSIIKLLPEVHELMDLANSTGRWINLSNPFGRFPTDAAHEADLSVGIGISTALTEAVVAGHKGVHCDLTRMYEHPFYKWGYQKVVFDDLGMMMDSIKRFKENSSLEPCLGDFKDHMDEIDPFDDGDGHRRIGAYLRSLMKSFEGGLDRQSAILQANLEFRQEWGDDKVVEQTK